MTGTKRASFSKRTDWFRYSLVSAAFVFLSGCKGDPAASDQKHHYTDKSDAKNRGLAESRTKTTKTNDRSAIQPPPVPGRDAKSTAQALYADDAFEARGIPGDYVIGRLNACFTPSLRQHFQQMILDLDHWASREQTAQAAPNDGIVLAVKKNPHE